MKDWSDAKKFIFEEIITLSTIIAATLFHDIFINLLHAVGLQNQPLHYNFGAKQIAITLIATLLLIRKWTHWRYYE